MRIILIKPPEQSNFNFGAFSLGALAAAVRDQAEVTILDATDWPVPAVVREVRARAPDLVGVTVMGLKSIPPAGRLIRQLATRGRRFQIVTGGHGATMLPAALLRAGADLVVLGEGETTFRRIVRTGEKRPARGAAWRVGKRIVTAPPQELIRPLDDLPLPARDLMPAPAGGIHLLETSRGCPHDCAFCETTRFFGCTWRPFSPKRVVRDVRRLVGEYGAGIIQITDDNFTADAARVLRLCRLLPNGPQPALFLCSARGDDLVREPELLPAMADARVLRVTVGVETLDPALARQAGKPIGAEVYRTAFRNMRRLGIFSIASFIIGLPGETRASRRQALALAIHVAPDAAHFLPFLPLPGTLLAAGQQGWYPASADVRAAGELSRAFAVHPKVRAQLRTARRQGGIRGLLARAAEERFRKSIPLEYRPAGSETQSAVALLSSARETQTSRFL